MPSSWPASAASPAFTSCDAHNDVGWVIRDPDTPSVVVAVQGPYQHVMRVDVIVGTDAATSTTCEELVARALSFCRDRDALKVLLTVTGTSPTGVRSLALSRGFQYSRATRVERADVAEFYTDLYWTADDTFLTRSPEWHAVRFDRDVR